MPATISVEQSELKAVNGTRQWKSVPIVIYHLTLSTFIGAVVRAGLQVEALVETPFNSEAVTDAHQDPSPVVLGPASADRATTLIIKARKPAR